ncbi:hypothetical protein D6T64_11785 [Cryobacterium melibiosiphilum]|uniref:Uncharacterized protein n=1 Tax=Cryobacterium melibiosiphilum TaxID=995039 RepID=A0A3A5MME8_9MICO|nr:hypothetical protein [Cryobacterium melibiosiphilum]RJT88063.1 hypothetical protein D6T64_11785 [Cryobacterium melibiosiphilum]
MSDKKISPRKTRNTAANQAQHAANVALVAALGIPAATSEHIKLRRDGKGNSYQVTTTKRVRESKLLRKAERERQRTAESIVREVKARAEDAATEAELVATVR